MRHLTILLLLAVVACDDRDPAPDYFSGSWTLIDNQIPMEISFDATRTQDRNYNFSNRRVIHPAIPVDQQDNNQMHAYEPFKDGTGFGRLEITSRGPFYYKIVMIYNRITDEGLSVYDIQVDIPSEDFIVLQDRTFTRK